VSLTVEKVNHFFVWFVVSYSLVASHNRPRIMAGLRSQIKSNLKILQIVGDMSCKLDALRPPPKCCMLGGKEREDAGNDDDKRKAGHIPQGF